MPHLSSLSASFAQSAFNESGGRGRGGDLETLETDAAAFVPPHSDLVPVIGFTCAAHLTRNRGR